MVKIFIAVIAAAIGYILGYDDGVRETETLLVSTPNHGRGFRIINDGPGKLSVEWKD